MGTDRRQQLLDAAIDLLQGGVAALTFARLAEAVGIRKPSVTHHFPTKLTVIGAVLDVEEARLDRLRARALACPAADARGLLLGILDDIAGIDHPTSLIPPLLALELRESAPSLAARCRELALAPRVPLLTLLGRALDAGDLPPRPGRLRHRQPPARRPPGSSLSGRPGRRRLPAPWCSGGSVAGSSTRPYLTLGRHTSSCDRSRPWVSWLALFRSGEDADHGWRGTPAAPIPASPTPGRTEHPRVEPPHSPRPNGLNHQRRPGLGLKPGRVRRRPILLSLPDAVARANP